MKKSQKSISTSIMLFWDFVNFCEGISDVTWQININMAIYILIQNNLFKREGIRRMPLIFFIRPIAKPVVECLHIESQKNMSKKDHSIVAERWSYDNKWIGCNCKPRMGVDSTVLDSDRSYFLFQEEQENDCRIFNWRSFCIFLYDSVYGSNIHYRC